MYIILVLVLCMCVVFALLYVDAYIARVVVDYLSGVVILGTIVVIYPSSSPVEEGI